MVDKQVKSVTHCVLFGSRNFLNSEGIVKQAVAWEVLTHILLNKFDSKIGVIDTLDLVTNARN